MTTNSSDEQRAVFGNIVFTLAALCLLIALVGMARVAYDVVVAGALANLAGKLLLLLIVFVFGLGLGTLSQRRFNNAGFPIFAQIFTWLYLTLVSLTYLGITFRVAGQDYSLLMYGGFLAVIMVELLCAFSMRLIIPGRTIGVFAVPMLAIVLFHLLLVVYLYVFESAPLTAYLAGDLFFLMLMTIVSSAMLGQNAFRAVIERVIDKIG